MKDAHKNEAVIHAIEFGIKVERESKPLDELGRVLEHQQIRRIRST